MKQLFIVILLIMINACATQPGNFNYYQLGPDTAHNLPAKTSDLSSKHSVLLTVKVPDYLKQNKMVVQTGQHQLHFAQLHLWAQIPLKSIRAALVNEISPHDAPWYMVEHYKNAPAQPHYQLDINIQQFYPTDSGKAILQGTWLFFVDGKAHTKQHFNYTETLATDGFSHAVSQQYQLLQQLSADLNSYFGQKMQSAPRHLNQ
ncbi:PqiC family protein [Planctobacterium marinum]|uniref:PqiC family protein n=1 Tax=Planctobacterium marinum TaxID=1631968 RepID=UPI001E4AE784|nr:ABC-type transport auxiliary lipoprotein family protein [Planctobacterium marinum]MCC2607263.1 PqiC family protein [Planctobacterium marinum]